MVLIKLPASAPLDPEDEELYGVMSESEPDDDVDDPDWEEVKAKDDDDEEDELEFKKLPILPAEGVDIFIEDKRSGKEKKKKRELDLNEIVRKHVNRQKITLQLNKHKLSLLLFVARGLRLLKIARCDIIRGLALSLVDDWFVTLQSSSTNGNKKQLNKKKDTTSGKKKIAAASGKRRASTRVSGSKKVCLNEETEDVAEQAEKFTSEREFILEFLEWFSKRIAICDDDEERSMHLKSAFMINLINCFKNLHVTSLIELVVIFAACLKAIKPNLPVRILNILRPITMKADIIPKNANKDTQDNNASIFGEQSSSKCGEESKKDEVNTLSTVDGKRKLDIDFLIVSNLDMAPTSTKKAKKASTSKEVKQEPKQEPIKKTTKRKTSKVDEAKSDEQPEESVSESGGVPEKLDFWIEIYSETENKWICVDVCNNKIDEPEVLNELNKPFYYLLSFDIDRNCIKPAEQYYCPDWYAPAFKRERCDPKWWQMVFDVYGPSKQNEKDGADEAKSQQLLNKQDLPKSDSAFRNHPLYVLQKHLLKYQVIYPPDCVPVGYFKDEPIYPRDNVHTCRSRETWLRQAKTVKLGEQPYKIVKARPKKDKYTGDLIKDLPLEIFGEWQTEAYVPPTAIDGKVPRNIYGNVDMYQPCMLPKGCAWLKLPGLQKVANKLNIDCAAAVIGFDNHCGSYGSHPVTDGFIVCEEYQDTLEAAWEEEQINARKREEDKRQKRIWDNWKRLLKAAIIREKLRVKYKD